MLGVAWKCVSFRILGIQDFHKKAGGMTCAVFLVAALALLSPASTMGQATSGTITGNVTDESGGSVPNATVTITDMDRGTQFTATTNGEGLFQKTQIPNGRYKIRVEAQGLAPYEAENVQVNVDQETRVYASLKPGTVTESVTVNASEQPALITDRAEVSTTVGVEELTRLPTLGQNVTQLELLSPGTVRNTFDISGNSTTDCSCAMTISVRQFMCPPPTEMFWEGHRFTRHSKAEIHWAETRILP
jgi:hypothetical protein